MNNKLLRLKFDFNASGSVAVMLPHSHRILAFGPDKQEVVNTGKVFEMISPYIDVILDTDTPHENWSQRRFIILPVGAEGDFRDMVRGYRPLLGSFVAPNGKQCYVFEGGMVGV